MVFTVEDAPPPCPIKPSSFSDEFLMTLLHGL